MRLLVQQWRPPTDLIPSRRTQPITIIHQRAHRSNDIGARHGAFCLASSRGFQFTLTQRVSQPIE